LGTTFLGRGVQGIVLKAVLALLALTVVYVFVRKRRGRPSRRRQPNS